MKFNWGGGVSMWTDIQRIFTEIISSDRNPLQSPHLPNCMKNMHVSFQQKSRSPRVQNKSPVPHLMYFEFGHTD